MQGAPRAAVQLALDKVNAKQPERDYVMSRCIDAWCDLSTCRAIGMAVGPIPWTAIVAWCEFHELDRDNTKLVTQAIRTIDIDRAEREQAASAQKSALGKGSR